MYKKKLQEYSSIFKKLFNLEYSPVAIRTSRGVLKLGDDKKLRICRAILEAGKGKILKIDKNNNACFGAAWHLGFHQIRDPKVSGMVRKFVVKGEKLFCSYRALDKLLTQMYRAPDNSRSYFTLSPLEKSALKPELVIFIVNPEAACRLLTLVTFLDGVMPKIKIGGPTCSMILIYPQAAQEVNLSFYDSTARKICNVEKDKLLITIPFNKIPKIIKSINRCSAGYAKIEYPQEFREFLQQRLTQFMEQKNILNFTLDELAQALASWKQDKFHARQIFFWIYKKFILDFELMSDLPLDLRKRLKDNFSISDLKPVKTLKSFDGTEKFLFTLKDNNSIETVSIPAKERITGCVSTQVGCKFGCRFCASGQLGFKRNLTTAEIIEQALFLKQHSGEGKLTHIVFMGIGEPLDNYANVLKAIRIINSTYALGIGARRITISTCGIIPAIDKLSLEGLQIELSISLHAADEKTRTQILPVNKIYPLKDLIFACKKYIDKTRRQITFEYVLIKGLNSDLQNARILSKILASLKLCKVNLIPCNPTKKYNLEPPNKLEALLFRDYLTKHGINVTIRRSRGEDIEAACGQLRLRHEEK